VMSDDNTKLTRPSGGCWMSPAFAQSLPNASLRENAWELYKEATDCPLGAGLAGTMAEEGGLDNRNVHWRNIKSLLDDPFVQREPGQRMRRVFDLGIGIVAAVPFCFQDEKGMVMYFSRSTADVNLLHAESNKRCLLGSADLIGANYAIRKARKESDELRKNRYQKAIRTARKEFLREKICLASMVMNKDHMEHLKKQREMEVSHIFGEKESDTHVLAVKVANSAYRVGRLILKRIIISQRKWRGARLNGPPRKPFSNCLFSFAGAFLTMLTILKIAKSVQADGKFDFEPGWYTSTLCIVFALTPAPVGQPRQIFSAHLWNMLVGLACRQIPTGGFGDFMEWSDASPDAEYGLPLIWVQALAVALGISGQAFIGILHPPATGLSMVFASDSQWTWSTIASVMMADSVVVVVSMLFLNLSEKEQYPMYWLGLGSGGTMGYVRSKSRSLRRSVSTARNSASVSLENIRAMISTDRVEQSHDILRRRPCDGDQCNVSYGSFNIPVWHSMEFDES